ncbi:MAG: hypothetical protein RL189_2424 [Pseudomonadota bacterium]|jgi:hypothetical protein
MKSAVLACSVFLFVLTACGGQSGNGSSAQPPSTSNPPAGNTADNSAATAPRKYTESNVCSLLTNAEAETFLGYPLKTTPTAKTETRIPQKPVSCVWTSPNSSGLGVRLASLIIWESNGEFDAIKFYDQARNEPLEDGAVREPVSGFGKDAYIFGTTLYIKLNRSFIQVRVGALSEMMREQTFSMARAVLSRYAD